MDSLAQLEKDQDQQSARYDAFVASQEAIIGGLLDKNTMMKEAMKKLEEEKSRRLVVPMTSPALEPPRDGDPSAGLRLNQELQGVKSQHGGQLRNLEVEVDVHMAQVGQARMELTAATQNLR